MPYVLGVPLVESALSEDALEEFGWLACAIREFCSALDTLSDMTSYKNMFVTTSSIAASARVLSLYNSSTLLANVLVA